VAAAGVRISGSGFAGGATARPGRCSDERGSPGTKVFIFRKYFSPKELMKKVAILTQNTAACAEKWTKHWFSRKTPTFTQKID
jgi:hypothetical protein